MTDLKGSKCRCGFALNTTSVKCPKCGKTMKQREWIDKGFILSCVKVGFPPEGESGPTTIALVQVVDHGPKIICWTDDCLAADDEVIISEVANQRYTCRKVSDQTPVRP